MRNLPKLALIIAGIAITSAFAQRVGDVVQPRGANVQLFANQIREGFEQPVATVSASEVLTITEAHRNHFKVRTVSGVEGFVSKNDVGRAASRGSARAFTFEAAEVQGYLDNPTPVYIIDMDDPNSDPISLERSFRENLRVNADRENLERVSR